MSVALIFLVPLLVATVVAYRADHGGRGALAVISSGVVLAVAFALVAYLRAPTDRAPFGCSDCGNFGGRWWDPAAVVVVALFGFGGWVAGTFVGAALRRLVGR